MEQLQIHYVDLGVPRVTDLKGELTVGRTEGNDLVLNHPSVSRRHARFDPRDDHWWIVDLKSTNGVKVNGNLVAEAQVNPGDKILIGSVQLELKRLPSVNFTGESMFDNPSGTVIRRISDFNSEFGLDLAELEKPTAQRVSDAGLRDAVASREKVFQVLVQVAKVLLQSEDLESLLNTVMDIIFKYLPVERGLIILFDENGEPVPKLTRFIEGADARDIPISRTILNMVAQQQVALMTSNALEDARLLGGKSIAIHGIRSAMCVPLWNRNRVIGAVQVDSPIHIGRFTEEDLDLITALANFAAVAIERAQLTERVEEERKIRSRMERYHSPAVVDEIVRGSIAADEEEIRTAEVSILFADISGFTTVSETKKPEEVAEFLSHFFSCAVESIFAYGGTLDKFIGDAVMAFFGAPIPQEDHADRAILAGLMMQRLVGEWNAEREKISLPPVAIRVGINSGPAVVGNVGTEKRVDYTVLGSAVNIASRLESGVAKPGQTVISKNTLERTIGSFQTESLGEVSMKGMQQKLPVFSVLAAQMGRTSPGLSSTQHAAVR
ncbi:MAG TPA: adenylate/guanylate cyclase domain-containing protein [Thermoanaerobaculia bacterium]|nr:adenylate/guanylate cyclase domain-containing protein [Thermoanaerobaculia bacterium]